MKYIKYLVLSLVLFFVLAINCNASTKTFERTKDKLLVPSSVKVTDDIINDILKTKAVDASEKVYDFAELLTDGEEKQLLKSIKGYTKDTDMDLVVVTTKELDGFSVGEYANNFYKYNKFSEDGVLFLISTATEDTNIYMVNSGKAKSIYTDGLVSSALKYVYTNVKEKKYSDALDDYVKIIDKYYIKEVGEKNEPATSSTDNSNSGGISPLNIILLSIALAFLISMIIFYVLTQKKIKRTKEKKEVMVVTNAINQSSEPVKSVNVQPQEEKVENNSIEPPIEENNEDKK